MSAWRRRVVLVMLPVAVACAGRATADGVWEEAGAVVVVPEGDATAVGLAVVVPGSGWEDAGSSGVTLLAAEALLAQAAPALSELGAEARVKCGRWAFTFELVAPGETWRDAAVVLRRTLTEGELSPRAVERARESLLTALRLDEANPAWQARLAARRALYASDRAESAWARPGCGVAETVAVFDVARVRMVAARFASAGGAAIVGAADALEGESPAAVLSPLVGDAIFPHPGAPAAGRVYVERNTVTAWLSVAWPFGPGVDPDAMHLVGALLEGEAGPSVSRPEVLHAGSEVELHGAGGALVVTVVAAPAAAAGMARRLEAAARALAETGGHPAVIDAAARRERGRVLRWLGPPEARAARAATALARGAHRDGGAWPSHASFTREAVRRAAGALGAPARAIVGPREATGAVVP